MKSPRSLLLTLLCLGTAGLSALRATDFPPLPLVDHVRVKGLEIPLKSPPKGLVVRENLGLLTSTYLDGQLIFRATAPDSVYETRAVITPGGDYLLMFPLGEHYGSSKGKKVNTMVAFRSKDRGRTWQGPTEPFKIDYSQHGFIPLIPRGTKRIYSFGTQPDPKTYDWRNGGQENTPIGYRWSDDDGYTWSDATIIAPINDPTFKGMSVMRMTETESGTWLLGSHEADWSVKPLKTRQYLLRSDDKGKTWNVLPGARPGGWFAEGFGRMDEGRPISVGGKNVAFMSRTTQGHLFIAWSEDDGKTWTKPAPSPLVHPDAPPMLFHLSDGKTLVAFFHNGVPVKEDGNLSAKSDNMAVRAQIWVSTSKDNGHTWSEPRFLLVTAAVPNLDSPWRNYQCSYLDALVDGTTFHLFMPHRWQQALHLTINEADFAKLPTEAELKAAMR
jgi:hypothetical protein